MRATLSHETIGARQQLHQSGEPSTFGHMMGAGGGGRVEVWGKWMWGERGCGGKVDERGIVDVGEK